MRFLKLLVPVAFITCQMTAMAADYEPLTTGITLETGDSWIDRGKRNRLYGVQSCLRGTFFTNRSGERRDCGEASMAVLAAFIRDTEPQCAPVAVVDNTRFVMCFGRVGKDRLDLATALITEGYAFAALNSSGLPIHPPYAVAEQQARARKTGLWQFSDVPHAALLLSQAARSLEGR